MTKDVKIVVENPITSDRIVKRVRIGAKYVNIGKMRLMLANCRIFYPPKNTLIFDKKGRFLGLKGVGEGDFYEKSQGENVVKGGKIGENKNLGLDKDVVVSKQPKRVDVESGKQAVEEPVKPAGADVERMPNVIGTRQQPVIRLPEPDKTIKIGTGDVGQRQSTDTAEDKSDDKNNEH